MKEITKYLCYLERKYKIVNVEQCSDVDVSVNAYLERQTLYHNRYFY